MSFLAQGMLFPEVEMIRSSLMQEIVDAGRARSPAHITYQGKDRVIEIHAFGVTRAGVPCIRVFQRVPLERANAWRLLHVDRIEAFKPFETDHSVPIREDFNPNDQQMREVLWHIRMKEEAHG